APALVALMFADWLQIKETALAGIALFRKKHANPGQLRFIAQHLGKTSKMQLLKMPAGIPTCPRLRPTARAPANNERANPFLNQQRNNAFAGSMQVLFEAALAQRGQALKPSRSPWFGHGALQLDSALVIELVNRLCWATVNKARNKVRFV